MDLLSNLNSAKWQNMSPDQISDMKEYTVMRSKMLSPGKWEYAVKEYKGEDADADESSLVIVAIVEDASGKRNPLQSVRNVFLKMENGKILAVNLEGDCVARK